MKNKKAQLNQMTGIILTLLVIGISIVIGITVLDSLIDTTYETTTAAIANESLTTVTNAGEDLAVVNYRDVTCTVTGCLNDTNTVVIAPSNYTATNCNVAFSSASTVDEGKFNNTDWNCSYSYTYEADTNASVAGDTTLNATADVVDWLPVIVVIIIAGIILALVYYFRKTGQ